MNRRRLLPVLLAAVCVLTLAFAAATVVDPEENAGGGSSVVSHASEEPGQSGDGGSSNQRPLTDPGELVFNLGTCIPFFMSGQFVALVLVVAVGLWALVRHRTDGVVASSLVVAVATPAVFVWMFLTNCGQQEQPERFSIIPSDPTPPKSGTDSAFGIAQDPGAVVTQPTVVLVLVAATAVVGVFGYVVWATDGEETDEPDPEFEPVDEDGESTARVAAIGNVAGRAADRLERTEASENEVYRAWVEMTTYLDVAHPDSSTPAEFARAAVRAGVARDDVDELTRLFEEVRYGGQPVTEERESRAVEALRRFEAEYGDGREESAAGGTNSGLSKRKR